MEQGNENDPVNSRGLRVGVKALEKYDLFVSGTISGGIEREKHKGGDYLFFRMKVDTCNYKIFDLRKML